MITCCFVGQDLFAQSVTLDFNGNSYPVNFNMSLEGAGQGQSANMDISISKSIKYGDKAIYNAYVNGTLIKNMTLTQTHKMGTTKVTLTNASIVAFSSGQSSKSQEDVFLVVGQGLNFEFTSKQGKNSVSHNF